MVKKIRVVIVLSSALEFALGHPCKQVASQWVFTLVRKRLENRTCLGNSICKELLSQNQFSNRGIASV